MRRAYVRNKVEIRVGLKGTLLAFMKLRKMTTPYAKLLCRSPSTVFVGDGGHVKAGPTT